MQLKGPLWADFSGSLATHQTAVPGGKREFKGRLKAPEQKSLTEAAG